MTNYSDNPQRLMETCPRVGIWRGTKSWKEALLFVPKFAAAIFTVICLKRNFAGEEALLNKEGKKLRKRRTQTPAASWEVQGRQRVGK